MPAKVSYSELVKRLHLSHSLGEISRGGLLGHTPQVLWGPGVGPLG
jgi:hypothetical protein